MAIPRRISLFEESRNREIEEWQFNIPRGSRKTKSIPSLGLKNPGFESPELKSPGLKSPLTISLKDMGEKSGVERSGVEAWG